ncbi:MAG: hypothetical protein IIB08_06380 [Bacteroidetes bacterium]|nr:hypothetical protein [Bacteroidota bacterium]
MIVGSELAKSEDQELVLARMDTLSAECRLSVLEQNSKGGKFVTALALADGMTRLTKMLTDELMAKIMPLL